MNRTSGVEFDDIVSHRVWSSKGWAGQRRNSETTWVEPIADFFRRYGKKALLLLALIGLYRISDIVAGVISNVFYHDMGFSKTDIANAVKLVGVIMVIAGGFLGGIMAQKCV